MYKATLSFTTKDYDVRKNQILADDFTTQDEINEFLNIGYITEYDDTLEIIENGEYDVEDYITADVNVPSSEPTLQSKTVTLTENGTTTVQADSGYDALSSVEVEVNVPIPAVFPPNWAEIGYTSTPQYIINGFNYAKEIYDNWNNAITSMSQKYRYDNTLTIFPIVDTSNVNNMEYCFSSCQQLVYIDYLDISNVTNANYLFWGAGRLITVRLSTTSKITTMRQMFTGCSSLLEIPFFDTSNVTDMYYAFNQCGSITSMPFLDTSKVTNFDGVFANCTHLISVPAFNTQNVTTFRVLFANCPQLTTVPVLNSSKVTNFENMFQNCANLSNESLNNILQMCINATSYTGRKTLGWLGLTSTQKSICQTLSNWNDFITAGWTAG